MTRPKTIIYQLTNDYFFCHFRPVYEVLRKDKRLNIFLMYQSWPYGNQDTKEIIDYLSHTVERDFIIPDSDRSFSPDMVISSEMHPCFAFPQSYDAAKKVQMYHGVGIYNFFDQMDSLKRYDVHCAVGPQYCPYLNELRKHRPDIRVYNTGFPKTDELFRHKPRPDSGKKVIVYSAHWSEHASLERFGEDVIDTMCSVPESVVWVRPHGHLFVDSENWNLKFAALMERHSNLKVIRDPDNAECYKQAAVVVTDIGSTATLEASILGLPVVVFDNQEWFLDKEHTDMERKMLDMGIRYNRLDELRRNLTDIVEGRMDAVPNSKQMAMNGLYSPGHATENVVDVILKEIGL